MSNQHNLIGSVNMRPPGRQRPPRTHARNESSIPCWLIYGPHQDWRPGHVGAGVPSSRSGPRSELPLARIDRSRLRGGNRPVCSDPAGCTQGIFVRCRSLYRLQPLFMSNKRVVPRESRRSSSNRSSWDWFYRRIQQAPLMRSPLFYQESI